MTAQLKKAALVLVAVLALTGMFSSRAYATHFRYSTISWSASPTNTHQVTFQIQSAWRWDFPWQISHPQVGQTFNSGYVFYFGDGSYGQMNLTVTAVDAANDWMVATTTLTHTYAGNGPYMAYFENCCRLSTLLDNNHDLNFILDTRVVLSNTQPNQSPTVASVPIIVMPAGVTTSFQIPASDPDGTIASYALSTTVQSGLDTPSPLGLKLTPSGLVTWTPATFQEGLHAIQFTITDNDGNTVPLDVLLNVIPYAGGTPPTVLINSSSSPVTVNAQAGVPLSVALGATDPDLDPATGLPNTLVTMGSGGLPVGATVTPTMPFTQRVPETATFTWTPTLAQAAQTYTVVFSATDNTGLQSTNSLTIHVASPQPPTATCSPATYAVQPTSAAGADVTMSAAVQDPNKLPLTVTWTADGAATPAQTDNVAGGTTGPTTLTSTQTFAVGSHSVVVAATNTFFSTGTCTIGVTVAKADQTITFPEVGPQTYGGAPIVLGATASSGLPVTYTLLSGPATLSGNTLTITGAGAIMVIASQAGDATFNPAADVPQEIVVGLATPVVSVTGGTFTYDGTPHAATVTATGVGGAPLAPVTVTYNGSAAVPVDAGTYTVQASYAGGANYAPASGSATVTINKATPAVTVTGGTFTYDGTPHAATVSVTGVGGAALSPVTVTYNGAPDVPVHGGSYAVAASFAGDANYLPASGTASISITRALPAMVVKAGTFTYDGTPHAATVSVTGVGGVALGPATVLYNGSPSVPTSAGSYPVQAHYAGTTDYDPVDGTGTLVINPASLTIAANSTSMSYGGVVPALGVTYTGFVGGDSPASLATPVTISTTATPTSPVGTYPIVVGGATSPNYTIAFVNGVLTVNPGQLTITADNQTKWVGADVPALTVTYAGFVNGDTAASLTTPVTVTTTATKLSPSGTYPIVVSGATDPNYTIVFANGTLTVVGLQQVKQTARAAIAALKPTGSRQMDHEIDEALREIDDSLNPKLWADDSHLTAKGQQVFEEEREAVSELTEHEIQRRAPAALVTALAAQADVLVKVDRALAQLTLDEATAAGINAQWLADPTRDLAQGDAQATKPGGGDEAIQHYRDAWQDVQQAVRRATHDQDHDGDHDGGPGHGGDHGGDHGHGRD
ncbi:MAG: hypothetical protein KGN76_02135 [Acidobacteriota bacterium]|nr:hypothetical protein [Acidobacteriota bacterium]